MLAGHMPELIIVLVLALVFFGPKRLPEIGSSVGKSIRSFRKSISEIDDPATDTIAPVAPVAAVPVPVVVETQHTPVVHTT
jgi:sec-independent protein translocase protein TatA